MLQKNEKLINEFLIFGRISRDAKPGIDESFAAENILI